MDNKENNMMNWKKDQVCEWINNIAREKEVEECGYLFEQKNIDGQRLWDYHDYQRLKELNVPSVGLKITLFKSIKTNIGNDYQ